MENAENYLMMTDTAEPFDHDSEGIVAAHGQKHSDDGDTVIVGGTEDRKESDFRITSNVILINADPDVIDGGKA